MSWVKLDDQFPEHPKVAGLDDRAFRIHVWALCYCARHLTDGHIALRGLRGCPAVTRKYTIERALRVLVGAGLWCETDDGIQIRDYLDYNPDRASVEKKRERQLERWHRWKARQERRTNAVTNGVRGRATNATPDPTPKGVGEEEAARAALRGGAAGEGEHPCPVCGLRFVKQRQVSEHLENVHGEELTIRAL